MKTKLVNRVALIVLLFVVIIITSSKPSRAADLKLMVTELPSIKNIQKIIVSGNVEVFLSQGNAENLKVYDDYNSKNALVQWQDGVLRIASYDDQKLSVWITVNNLTEIDASGQSTIRSMNQLSAVDLDITLHDEARAALDAKVYNLNTSIADSSKLELSGESENHSMNLSDSSSYESTGFIAENRSISIRDEAEASFLEGGKITNLKSANTITSEKEFSFD